MVLVLIARADGNREIRKGGKRESRALNSETGDLCAQTLRYG